MYVVVAVVVIVVVVIVVVVVVVVVVYLTIMIESLWQNILSPLDSQNKFYLTSYYLPSIPAQQPSNPSHFIFA